MRVQVDTGSLRLTVERRRNLVVLTVEPAPGLKGEPIVAELGEDEALLLGDALFTVASGK